MSIYWKCCVTEHNTEINFEVNEALQTIAPVVNGIAQDVTKLKKYSDIDEFIYQYMQTYNSGIDYIVF
jgi:hypothetical protein